MLALRSIELNGNRTEERMPVARPARRQGLVKQLPLGHRNNLCSPSCPRTSCQQGDTLFLRRGPQSDVQGRVTEDTIKVGNERCNAFWSVQRLVGDHAGQA